MVENNGPCSRENEVKISKKNAVNFGPLFSSDSNPNSNTTANLWDSVSMTGIL